MSERNFNFDPRVSVPEAPEGKVVVKFYGMPAVVSAPLVGEMPLANGLYPSQLPELASLVQQRGVGELVQQKRLSGMGALKLGNGQVAQG